MEICSNYKNHLNLKVWRLLSKFQNFAKLNKKTLHIEIDWTNLLSSNKPENLSVAELSIDLNNWLLSQQNLLPPYSVISSSFSFFSFVCITKSILWHLK